MDVAELRKTVTELRAANVELGATVSKLEKERERYRVLYQQMLEKARKLELGLLGQKSERLPADELQLSILMLAGLLGEQDLVVAEGEKDEEEGESSTEGEAEDAEPEPRPKPTGRRPIPENLPVVDIEVIPDKVLQAGLEHFDQLGEEVLSTLKSTNAKIQALKKRACGYRNRDRFRRAILFNCGKLDLHPRLATHTVS